MVIGALSLPAQHFTSRSGFGLRAGCRTKFYPSEATQIVSSRGIPFFRCAVNDGRVMPALLHLLAGAFHPWSLHGLQSAQDSVDSSANEAVIRSSRSSTVCSCSTASHRKRDISNTESIRTFAKCIGIGVALRDNVRT